MVSDRAFQFGDWLVEPPRGRLTGHDDGREVRLEPKLMDLLVLFATSNGRVLAKDEILAAVWDGRAVGDDTLAAAISRLRSALGETPQRRYIETVPKRGYRLAMSDAAAEGAAPAEDAPGSVSEAARLARQGAAALASGSPAGLPQARLYFEAAIRSDPRLAQAQAGLAETLFAQHFMTPEQGLALLPLAQAAASAAVGLDDELAWAWTTFGYAALIVDRDVQAADRAFLHAISLDPAAAAPHRYRAIGLAAAGRAVEAERESRRAVEIEPLSLTGRGALLQILMATRRFRQAVAEADATIRLSSMASEAWYAKGWALVLLGERAEGVAAFLHGLSLWGVDPARINALTSLYEAQGFPALCAGVADYLETQQVMFAPRTTDIAVIRTAAGQFDAAFAALERAVAANDPYVLLVTRVPWFDPLKGDPRWPRLVAAARLPT